MQIPSLNPYPLVLNDNPLLRRTLHLYETFLLSFETSNKSNKPNKKFFSNIKQSFQQQPNKPTQAQLDGILLDMLQMDLSHLEIAESLQPNLLILKRSFEEESKKYYDFISKWFSNGLSLNYKNLPADRREKLFKRLKQWNLSRIKYFDWCYNEVIKIYIQVKVGNSITRNKVVKYFKENLSSRQALLKKLNDVNTFDELYTIYNSITQLEIFDNELLLIGPNEHLLGCISGISLIRHPDDSKLKKANCSSLAGLLFTQHGQKKPGWHKQWVCIRNNTFYEYIDWRSCKNLRNEGLNLGLCNIKLIDGQQIVGGRNDPADSIGSRINLFRVMSNLGVEHIFQANSSEDLEKWLNCVEIDSRFSTRVINRAPSGSRLRSMTTGTTSSIESIPRSRRVSSVSSTLLKRVYKNSRSNLKCCDCGAEGPDWVSLNLLVVFCINCSACHRSLGSGITKVRSLTLDTFKDSEVRILLERGINNGESNKIWLSGTTNNFISPDSNTDDRSVFIKQKYVDRKWLRKQSTDKNLNELMESHEYNEIIEYIINKGPKLVNLKPSLEYTTVEDKTGHVVYDISELMLLNGVSLDANILLSGDLTDESKLWLKSKIDRLSGSTAAATSNNGKNAVLAPLATPKNSPAMLQHRLPSKKSSSPREGFSKFRKKMLG